LNYHTDIEKELHYGMIFF